MTKKQFASRIRPILNRIFDYTQTEQAMAIFWTDIPYTFALNTKVWIIFKRVDSSRFHPVVIHCKIGLFPQILKLSDIGSRTALHCGCTSRVRLNQEMQELQGNASCKRSTVSEACSRLSCNCRKVAQNSLNLKSAAGDEVAELFIARSAAARALNKQLSACPLCTRMNFVYWVLIDHENESAPNSEFTLLRATVA